MAFGPQIPIDGADITEGENTFVFEGILDGKIVVVSGSVATHSSVDAWANTVSSIKAAWPPEKPWLILHDFSQSKRGLAGTPYAWKRAKELTMFRGDMRGRVAIVVPTTFFTHLTRAFFLSVKPTATMQLFFSREEALRWLRQEPRH